MPLIVAVMGPTCAGKSTFLSVVKRMFPEHVGLVEVGRMLRAKYPPEYFAGQNNPKHTAKEAWDLCEESTKRFLEEGRSLILVDGQPRDLPQIDLILTSFQPVPVRFGYLTCTEEVAEQRARATRADNPANLDLALARIKNDRVAYEQVLGNLKERGIDLIFNYDTSDGLDCETLAQTLMFMAG